MTELTLPPFLLDCRDWIVERPETDACDADDAPVVAVLSTVVIDDDICEATGSLRVGVLHTDEDLADLDPRPVRPGSDAHEVLDLEPEPGTRRYVMPAPGGFARQGVPRLALVAEFTVPLDPGAELDRRVDELMGSFRWQAA